METNRNGWCVGVLWFILWGGLSKSFCLAILGLACSVSLNQAWPLPVIFLLELLDCSFVWNLEGESPRRHKERCDDKRKVLIWLYQSPHVTMKVVTVYFQVMCPIDFLDPSLVLEHPWPFLIFLILSPLLSPLLDGPHPKSGAEGFRKEKDARGWQWFSKREAEWPPQSHRASEKLRQMEPSSPGLVSTVSHHSTLPLAAGRVFSLAKLKIYQFLHLKKPCFCGSLYMNRAKQSSAYKGGKGNSICDVTNTFLGLYGGISHDFWYDLNNNHLRHLFLFLCTDKETKT